MPENKISKFLNTIICGDCLEVMKDWPANSFDAVVTDIPYGIGFMGKEFDTFSNVSMDAGFCHWLAGFVDGEGCFSVHKKNVNNCETYDCQFSITLRADDKPILERIQGELGIGTLATRKPKQTNAEEQARFCVSSKADCVILRDIFRAFPLRAKKATDFELWSDALDEWLKHKVGKWEGMRTARNKLMANRKYKPEGVRVNPYQLWCMRWAKEALRVAKPGAFLLCFGGTRTSHRLTCGLEDAGWLIRDKICWIFGSGFPKSTNISLQFDKVACRERLEKELGRKPTKEEFKKAWEGFRKVVGKRTDGRYKYGFTEEAKRAMGDIAHAERQGFVGKMGVLTEPNTNLAKLWDGYGTALKPAYEDIIVAMKPLDGTFAANAEKWGCAGLNIDGGRIATTDNLSGGAYCKDSKKDMTNRHTVTLPATDKDFVQPQGRWPANVILDEEAARLLDEQSGESKSSGGRIGKKTVSEVNIVPAGQYQKGDPGFGDSGGASRFFYCAKASRAERNAGLEGMPLGEPPASARSKPAEGRESPLGKPRQNHHPTVKPLALMEYLCKLLRPPGEHPLLLDPFCGSGTTLIAAYNTGWDWIGIEKELEYVKIAEKRITKKTEQYSLIERSEKTQDERAH